MASKLLIFLVHCVVIIYASEEWTCPLLPPVSIKSCTNGECPFVDGAFSFINGKIEAWQGEVSQVETPIVDASTGSRGIIGSMAQMSQSKSMEALESAERAWDHGQGIWPQMSRADRIAAVEAFVIELKEKREEIGTILMWEICKQKMDAFKEFDRTIDFINATISTLKSGSLEEPFASWNTVSGLRLKVKRGPIGVNLLLAPFNYPLNEMYAMLIPSLLMGNVVVMKLPNIGGLVHLLTAPAFASTLPPGVVNFISGSGPVTCTPIMASGSVDMIGFIGSSKTADILIRAHPKPHRLKVFSQLEGKNLGIVMKDVDMRTVIDEVTLGALNYNGQRCTAIKLVLVHRSLIDKFLDKLKLKVGLLKYGLPWEEGVSITPLPEPDKPIYLQGLIADAVRLGAKVINAEGGNRYGPLFVPALVYPVDHSMRLFHEEQFGPVVPIAVFDDVQEVIEIAKHSWNGQQAAIFTKDMDGDAAPLLDALSTILGRVNINMQCSRSPDVVPFSGRRSSAMGTMSVSEALKYFSVETVVSFKESLKASSEIIQGVQLKSKFLASM